VWFNWVKVDPVPNCADVVVVLVIQSLQAASLASIYWTSKVTGPFAGEVVDQPTVKGDFTPEGRGFTTALGTL
jgi:hypothetical protein